MATADVETNVTAVLIKPQDLRLVWLYPDGNFWDFSNEKLTFRFCKLVGSASNSWTGTTRWVALPGTFWPSLMTAVSFYWTAPCPRHLRNHHRNLLTERLRTKWIICHWKLSSRRISRSSWHSRNPPDNGFRGNHWPTSCNVLHSINALWWNFRSRGTA